MKKSTVVENGTDWERSMSYYGRAEQARQADTSVLKNLLDNTKRRGGDRKWRRALLARRGRRGAPLVPRRPRTPHHRKVRKSFQDKAHAAVGYLAVDAVQHSVPGGHG